MPTKFITLQNLTYFWQKAKEWILGLGYQNAAQVEQTVTSKGYQTSEQVASAVASATTDMATQTWVNGKGYQTSEQVEGAIASKGYQTASQVSEAVNSATANMATSADLAEATAGMATQEWVNGKGYQDSEAVSSAISAATAGMATQAWVGEQAFQTSSQVADAIDAKIAGVYEPKGSVAFEGLPNPEESISGDVYNVSDAFTTNDSFVEGSGKSYPAGTNVVCVSNGDGYAWDVLAGFVDLSSYLQESDIVAVSTGEIDSIFAE